MLLKNVRKEDTDGMAKDDRVADLHHRCLHVKRKENAERLRITHLFSEEHEERFLAHVGAVEDLPFEQPQAVLQRRGRSVLSDMLDANGGGRRQGDRLLVVKKVAGAHRRHVRLRLARPGAHRVRIRARVLFHSVRRTTVRVALAENRVDGAAFDLAVPLRDRALLVGLRLLRVVRHRKALGLQFSDRGLHLRHRRTDVRKLDDVCLRCLRKAPKLCQRVADPLPLGERFREVCQYAACERDVGKFHGDVRRGGEGPQDRQ